MRARTSAGGSAARAASVMNYQGEDRWPTACPLTACRSGHRHRAPSCTGTCGQPPLVEQAVAPRRGLLAKDGPLVVETGKHTGRSAKDKFIVRDAETENTIWWDNNKSMTPEHFAALKADFLAALADKDDAVRRRPVRRLAARAPRPRARDQRARLAQPVHPHAAGPPRSRGAGRLRARIHDHRPAELPRRSGAPRHPHRRR